MQWVVHVEQVASGFHHTQNQQRKVQRGLVLTAVVETCSNILKCFGLHLCALVMLKC